MRSKIFDVNISLCKLHYWLVLFLILYTSDSIYTCVYNKLDNFIEIFTELLMMLFMIYIHKKQLVNIIEYMSILALVMLVLSSVHVKENEYIYMFLIIIRIMSTLIFITGCMSLEFNFFKDIASLIYFIAIFGIACYLLFEINPFGLVPHISYVLAPGDGKPILTRYINFYNIYYRWDARVMYVGGIKLVRENGFFREVGVYAIFLNFALLFYLFTEQKSNKVKIFVLTLSIILARSTMGLLIMLIIFVLKLLNNNFKLMIAASPIILALSYGFYIVAYRKFEGGAKIAGRYNNLMIALRRIKENPILGMGCNRKYLSWYGLLNYFIYFGLAGLYPIIIIVKGLITNKRGVAFGISFFTWFFLSLMNETAGYNLFFLSLYSFIALNGLAARRVDGSIMSDDKNMNIISLKKQLY